MNTIERGDYRLKALMHENRTLSSTVCSMPTHLPDSPTQQHAREYIYDYYSFIRTLEDSVA